MQGESRSGEPRSGNDGGAEHSPPGGDRRTSRQRYRLTREWHFVDIELDEPDLTAACFGHPAARTPASEGPAKSCVVDRIAAFVTELRDLPLASPERTVAFKFVLHLED